MGGEHSKQKTDVITKDKEIDKLREEVHMLENENFELKEEIEFLQDQEVKTFEGGQYSDSVCEVYQYYVAQGISCHKVEDLIRKVLQKLSRTTIGRQPKKKVLQLK